MALNTRELVLWLLMFGVLLYVSHIGSMYSSLHLESAGGHFSSDAVARQGRSSLPRELRVAAADSSASSLPAARLPAVERPALELEVWAKGPNVSAFSAQHAASLKAVLTGEEVAELRALCGRCIYHTLANSVQAHGPNADWVFVATGDIPDEWIRDSSVQLGIYLPRMATHPALRRLIEGAIRTQAFFILQDPWANSYYSSWHQATSLSQFFQRIGRGGWVASRNYELDSGAYFMHLLANYATTPGLWRPQQLLGDASIHDAMLLMIKVWQIEQHHEERSPYRYAELPREGRGQQSSYTGMVWSGYRPSDDANTYGYNIPGNIYALAALQKVLALNRWVWQDPEIHDRATQLVADIAEGIAKHGIVTAADGSHVYAYEVDGRGNALVDFDDPNIPSLLSIPLLGWSGYDPGVYAATRSRILSKANPFYFQGRVLTGMGSPHTPHNHVWALSHVMEALTTTDVKVQAGLLRQLLKMQCGNALMHESIHVDSPNSCTRPIFEWANAMLVVAVEQLLHIDCDAAAEEARLAALQGAKHETGLYYAVMEGTLNTYVKS